MRLVLDASAAVRLVMRAEAADDLLEPVSAATLVAAPGLYAGEVTNALWKYVKVRRLEVETGLERYGEAINLINDFISDRELATEAFMEAVRYRHPVYDLLYTVLARRTGCAILTLDQRLKMLADQMVISTIPA